MNMLHSIYIDIWNICTVYVYCTYTFHCDTLVAVEKTRLCAKAYATVQMMAGAIAAATFKAQDLQRSWEFSSGIRYPSKWFVKYDQIHPGSHQMI